jgi:hypothetical protein
MAAAGARAILASSLIAIATNGASAAPPAPRALPLPYNMSRFPAAWFGGNDTVFESEASLETLGKYSLAILSWQALLTATNWTASVYAQLAQAAVIKARHPNLPVFVYQGRVHVHCTCPCALAAATHAHRVCPRVHLAFLTSQLRQRERIRRADLRHHPHGERRLPGAPAVPPRRRALG